MTNQKCVLVCGGTGCGIPETDKLYQALISEVKTQEMAKNVQVVKGGCFGFCGKGPIVKILPDKTLYVTVQPSDAREIITKTLVEGRVINRLLLDEGKTDGKFQGKQVRIVLRNCGLIDPENIEDYIVREGYGALEKVLFDMTPEEVIAELKVSGLRGRGGAGFPTGLKWSFTRSVEADQKFVVCNADEGDPGAYMDRSTLEGDPHSILEAMTIAGYTIGANLGIIYIRAEYPLAIERLRIAMEQARDLGLLGEDILGSGFDFNVEIRLGAGAFVCGEETALLRSIEGNRGMPTPKPPFPAVEGLWKSPTLINNVETYANIPMIILKGGNWFSSIGTEKSSGTKVFALTGKINNSGLVEVPMGTTLREIVYDIGGGIKNNVPFKAVQTGGPSGGVITKEFLDTPIDFDSLVSIGSMMGSGGMIVMDEDDCIVDVAKFYMAFCVEESCGKCSPCRIGTKKLYNILDKIARGKATQTDREGMIVMGEAMQRAALCGLGQTAPNPVLSSMRYFAEEYRVHLEERRCPAGKCKDLVHYIINPEKCIGCTLCRRKCPVNCISGERKTVHVIDQDACVKCGECYAACKFNAISKS